MKKLSRMQCSLLQSQLPHQKSGPEALLTLQQCVLAKTNTPGGFCWKGTDGILRGAVVTGSSSALTLDYGVT